MLLLEICMIVLCINEQWKSKEAVTASDQNLDISVFTIKEISHLLYQGIVGRFRAICDQQDPINGVNSYLPVVTL